MQDYALKKADGTADVHESFLTNFKQLLQISTLRWLYAGFAVYVLLQFAVATWFPALLMRALNVRRMWPGTSWAGSRSSASSAPCWAACWLTRWQKKSGGGRMRLAATSISIAVVFLMLVLVAAFDIRNRALLIFSAVMMPLYSIFIGMATPAIAATTQDVVPDKLRGLSWGTGMLFAFYHGRRARTHPGPAPCPMRWAAATGGCPWVLPWPV